MSDGAALLNELAKSAVGRLLAEPHRAVLAHELFTPEERDRLAAELAACTATAGLLGRSLVRDHAARVNRRRRPRLKESRDVPGGPVLAGDPGPAAGAPDPRRAGPLDVPFVRQDTSYSCGAACLKAVLDYHGTVMDEGELARLLGTSPAEGTSPEAMERLAGLLGLETEARDNASLDDVVHALANNAPCVCAVQAHGGGHWVVVLGVAGDRVTFMDPMAGIGDVPAEEFVDDWWDTAGGKRYDRYALAVGPAACGCSEAEIEAVLEGFFADCERDDKGHCVGSGGGDADGAKEEPKPAAEAPPAESPPKRSLLQKAKALGVAIALKVGELAPDLLDTGDDFAKIFYTSRKAGGADWDVPVLSPMQCAHIAGFVLAKAALWAKHKLRGPKPTTESDTSAERRERLADGLLHVFTELHKEYRQLGPAPTREEVEDYLDRERPDPVVEGNFFSDCDRDEHGHCVGSGGASSGGGKDKPTISTADRPKTKSGLYMKEADLHAAAADPAKEKALRADLHPKDKKKFDGLMQRLRGSQAGQPAKPAAASPAPAASPQEHAQHVLSGMKALDQGVNLVSMADMRDHLGKQGLDRAQQDAAIVGLMRQGVLSGSGPEGRHGITPREQEALMPMGDQRVGYLSLRHVESLQSRPASPLHALLEAQALAPLAPEAALDFFRQLIPSLAVDPLRVFPDLRRATFTLAQATEQELLATVKQVILDRLQSGDVGTGPAAVRAVLDQAGVSQGNPQYAETVFRTNAVSAYNQGVQDQLVQEAETFSVWKYSNPTDSRSRPEHAARDGRYYPASVPFNAVRGTDKKDVMNCRCTPIPIDKWTWEELQAKGAKLSTM